MLKVRKRDGTVVDFDTMKIAIAVQKAGVDSNKALMLAQDVAVKYTVLISYPDYKESIGGVIDIENIQDTVERFLMQAGLLDEAKRYILYREEHAKKRVPVKGIPDDAISDYMHFARYSRYLPQIKRRETWVETIDRRKGMDLNKFPHLKDEIEWAYSFVYQKRTVPSMRSLQFAGPAAIKDNSRMYNCTASFVDRPRVFAETFHLLLMGCGVGYSVQHVHIQKLPKLCTIDESRVYTHQVEDSIEGWADAVDVLINSYMLSIGSGTYIEFDYSKIRVKGTELKTSGGKAPGHVPLKVMLERVRSVLDKAQGRQLTSLECHDVMCFIAEAVLAGGIRRSSLICLFDNTDKAMLECKTGNWFKDNLQRRMANNSAVFIRTNDSPEQRAIYESIFQYTKEYGEPGFLFTDSPDNITNPCGEIMLCPRHPMTGETGFQFCNLTDVNCAANKTLDELKEAVRAASFLGTLQASYTHFPYQTKATTEIVRNEALVGVGMTGIMNNPLAMDHSVQHMLRGVAIEENIRVSKLIGIKAASRVTTVKPSGNSSLLLSCSSGIHPEHAHKYIRRITANKTEPVFKFFKEHNPHMVVDSVYNNNDAVIEFPVIKDPSTVTTKDMPADKFMNFVFDTYKSWIQRGDHYKFNDWNRNKGDHNISCTVSVKPEEWDIARDLLWENKQYTNGMSFLPETGDKIYPQAPREAVVTTADEARWNELVKGYKKVPYELMTEEEDNVVPTAVGACEGGLCLLDNVKRPNAT